MIAILFRSLTKTLLQSRTKTLPSCLVTTGHRCLQSTATPRSLHQARASKSTPKRLAPKNPADECLWSVIAYNLSEELKIENVRKLLESLREYQIKEIPEDLQDEAVVLSSKPFGTEEVKPSATKPLNDVFIFREGSIVFWGVPYDQQKRILYGLSPLKIDPYSNDLIQEEREHLAYSLISSSERSRLNKDIVQLATAQDPPALLMDQYAFSHAVALSVKLGIWESMLDQYIESVSWMTSSMKTGKDLKLTRSQVFRKTGEIYELKHRINLSSDLLDLPDIYWDRHNQEVLYLALTSFLNIKKRTAVINEKLSNCCELMNLLASHLNDKHHIRLEWMIIVLILVEVLFEAARFV